MLPVIDVPEHVERWEPEPLGTKPKFWFLGDDLDSMPAEAMSAPARAFAAAIVKCNVATLLGSSP